MPQTEQVPFRKNRTSQPKEDKFWSRLNSQSIGIPTLVLFLVGVVFAARETFVPLFIKDLNVALNSSWFYTASSIASLCSRKAIGPLSVWCGTGLLISISLLLYGDANFVDCRR